MKNHLMKIQSYAVYSIEIVFIALFVLYLGFMTHYYILFYDGTFEMFEYYKKLQIFNKEAFSLIVQFVLFAVVLLIFELHKVRPGLFGLIFTLSMTAFVSINSFLLIRVIPIYKRGYLALDFTSMEDYTPSTFVFDLGLLLHFTLIGLLLFFTVIAIANFAQRLKDGNPLIRKLK